MVFAVVGVWIAGRYEEWLPGTHALVLGLGVALVAPVGDLFESFVKREAHIKDSGGLFGAHGGALDRLDAVLFTAVVGLLHLGGVRALSRAAGWRSAPTRAIPRPGVPRHR